jgi:hypothetical protein
MGQPGLAPAVLLSAADTDLLAARSGGRWRLANPARTDPADLAAPLYGVLRRGPSARWPPQLGGGLAPGPPIFRGLTRHRRGLCPEGLPPRSVAGRGGHRYR